MKKKEFIAILLLLVAGLQTAWSQGFRVYKSDGTVAQFSLRKDSIIYYDNIGSDVDFGPFTPVNQCIVGTWYKTKSETLSFNEDGTTDYIEGATYEFLPYQGTVIFYNTSGTPTNILKVYKTTPESMIIGSIDGSSFEVLTREMPVVLVSGITLSETSLTLKPDEAKTITATVLPADADNPAVTWESSNEDVAEVNGRGRVIANGIGSCTITCRATDGSTVYAECQVTVDEHEWVDLGLPSGTLWATCNIGANSPEKYGDYYAWGETTTKSTYSWSNYKYCGGSSTTMTKYCTSSSYGTVDNKTELEPSDDAATANWGSNWQMPSYVQIAELINSSYTTTTWTTQNGYNGRKITSKSNGKSIFLPAAGYCSDAIAYVYYAGSNGFYWSRSLDTSHSHYGHYLAFSSSSIITFNDNRYYGRSVRPVRVQTR